MGHKREPELPHQEKDQHGGGRASRFQDDKPLPYAIGGAGYELHRSSGNHRHCDLQHLNAKEDEHSAETERRDPGGKRFAVIRVLQILNERPEDKSQQTG